MSDNGEIYTADKNFTLPPAVTALTNSTSDFEFETGRLQTNFTIKFDLFDKKQVFWVQNTV